VAVVAKKYKANREPLPLGQRQKLSPPQLARLWGVDAVKVARWIESGELRAINAATNVGGRPRYLIDRADIAAFELRRATSASVSVPRSRRQRADVKEFV
jgi:hypothetical protein